MTKSSFGSYDSDTQQGDRDGQLVVKTATAPLRKFAVNPLNRKLSAENVAAMAASLARWGQFQPIRVVTVGAWRKRYPDRKDAFGSSVEFVVIIGNCRVLGAREISLERMEYVVDNALVTKGRHPAEMILEENLQRTDLTCMDEARQIAELLPLHGDNVTRVAEHMGEGYSRSWVSQRKSLLGLPQLAKDAIDMRLIDFKKARSLVAMAPEAQLDQLAEWGIHAEAGDSSGTRVPDSVNLTKSGTRVPLPKAPSEKTMAGSVKAFATKHGPQKAGRVLREQLDDDQAVQAVEAMVEDLGPTAFRRLLDSLTHSRPPGLEAIPEQPAGMAETGS